jgi:hypothetical protein
MPATFHSFSAEWLVERVGDFRFVPVCLLRSPVVRGFLPVLLSVLLSNLTVLAKSIFLLEVRRTTAQNEQHFCMRQHEHSLVVKLREATTLGWDE